MPNPPSPLPLQHGALLTVEDNPMTLSWGSVGSLWGRHCCTLYLRPSRYTAELLRSNPHATLALLPRGGQTDTALAYCGSHSGRAGEKWTGAGLTPRREDAYCYPAEAKRLLFLRLLCRTPLSIAHFAPSERAALAERFYPAGDLHELCIFEIEKERMF